MTGNILVTGGAGYIGAHTCKALAAAGYTPIAYDNLSRGFEWAVKWGPLETGDIRDRQRLDEVMAQYRPVAVMHFAAHLDAGESMHKPLEYWENNVGGTLTLLRAMRDRGIRQLVFSSSCSVYGETGRDRVAEDAPKQPVSVYGETKLRCEELIRRLCDDGSLQAVALRYFNASGADPDGEIGEAEEVLFRLLPNIMKAVKNGQALTINGNDYDTGDGTCVRDYIHVSDLADAHVKALQRLASTDTAWAAYNLGTTQGHSVLQCIETAREVTGRELPVTFGPRRNGDPAYAVADASLAMRELDWHPAHPELRDIVDSCWRWMQRDA